MIHQNPHISTRRVERKLGIPQTTAHRLLRSVNYHPFNVNNLLSSRMAAIWESLRISTGSKSVISTTFTKGYKNIDYFCRRIICHFTDQNFIRLQMLKKIHKHL
ncbi:hypothetical protein ALC60_07627 [Trachymyrmex zeteki]|uniref:HTH iclR-type domain-containing protein n=1 Tax=Mycetomoellerius zeteki TaxID=64791 RepID=A0A151WZP6_9HYME|nr:hypothetical protein ALC60_07627 [Trachymyrmex zeteki]